MSAHAGERYFVHQAMSDLGGYAHARLRLVDDDTGRDLLDACDTHVTVAAPEQDGSVLLPIVPARF